MKEDILNNVSDYYSKKIEEHGLTPKGVDWNSEESQTLRFDQLTKIINKQSFSVIDYGCGYGALLDYIKQHYSEFQYTGFDISKKMIEHAHASHSSTKYLWTTEDQSLQPADYVIASGIFNVKLDHSEETWKSYILQTLHKINTISQCGFSFNILTSYSDRERMKSYLYYADSLFLFDYCKRNFSKEIALLHDYPLYEFTILVRK